MIVFLRRRKMGKFIDLSGMVFGKWTVIEKDGYFNFKSASQVKWKCICECGKLQYIPTTFLKSGRSSSCRRCSEDIMAANSRIRDVKYRLFKDRIIQRLKKTGLDCTLDKDSYYEIAKQPCFYCDEEPKPYFPFKRKLSGDEVIYVNGVDRLDNTKGYHKNNCVACCKDCNYAKNDQSMEDFLGRVKRIYFNCIHEEY